MEGEIIVEDQDHLGRVLMVVQEILVDKEIGQVVQGKCIKQHVQNVTVNVTYLSSQLKVNQYIAGNVSGKEGKHHRGSNV
jgi:hypothetical protein